MIKWTQWCKLERLYPGFLDWEKANNRSLHVSFWRLWPPWRTDKHWPWRRYSIMLVRDRKE